VTTIDAGTEAPDFQLPDQHGQQVRLADFRGSKNVVLVFFPYAFTNVCTGEMCALRDDLPSFQNDDVQVIAVSCDTMFTQRVYAEREGLQFPVLSDFWPHGAVAARYGVFDAARGCALRGTFIIDKNGILRWTVVHAVPDARDQAEYLKVLAELQATGGA
jgi:mycoredoxin-dependent peroxiredoxin